jgi:protein FAM32A
MPSSDYAAAGGALKLKGSSGVSKKKKKSKKPKTDAEALESAALEKVQDKAESSKRQEPLDEDDEESIQAGPSRPKTEAELKFEEQRRKRLEEKLEKEGVKTHKERVQGLNRYLSKLSEHHDM